jgi:hypothetical protein
MTKFHDLAIRWNNKKSSINQLIKTGRVSVWGRPQYLRPGGWVAIVTDGNLIRLLFKVATIEGPKSLKLASGKTRENSYIIKAEMKTIRQPEETPSPIKRWRAIGQYRYFDASKMKSIQINPTPRSSGKYIDNYTEEVSGTRFKPHTKGIPGMPHTHPEAQLVEQYVQWMKGSARFGHNYIRAARLYVDLFDLTHWQLIEAKAGTSRETMRMAIGQLRDYKRYYKRPASLGVLLPSRPTDDCVKLLTDNRISVIWRTPTGIFSMNRWQD